MDIEAGRALDALVAERVMGWRRCQPVQRGDGWWYCPGCRSYYGRAAWPDEQKIRAYWCGRNTTEAPHYSTDIAAAFTVAAKLGLALVPQSDGDGGFTWLACDLVSVSYAGTITLDPKEGTAWSAPTAPLAVCRAALASVGEQ